MKNFSFNVLLSITDGRLICEMDEIDEILNYLTQDDLFTHQLPRAKKEVAPILIKKFPELASKEVEYIIKDVCSRIPETVAKTNLLEDYFLPELNGLLVESGLIKSEYTLFPVSEWEHERIDPITELIEMVQDKGNIIQINLDEN